jgi:hypothetical protein
MRGTELTSTPEARCRGQPVGDISRQAEEWRRWGWKKCSRCRSMPSGNFRCLSWRYLTPPPNSLTIHDLRHYVGMVYGPIGAFLAEYFPAVSATPRCRGRITSAMARAAD